MTNEEKYKAALERIVFLCGPGTFEDREIRAEKGWPHKTSNSGYCKACIHEGQYESCWLPELKAIAEAALKEYSEDCVPIPASSRVCERGTRSCNIKHEEIVK